MYSNNAAQALRMEAALTLSPRHRQHQQRGGQGASSQSVDSAEFGTPPASGEDWRGRVGQVGISPVIPSIPTIIYG